MKKTIACTTKANKTQVWHEDLQCFAAEWGLDFAWNETEAITTLTASEAEIDSGHRNKDQKLKQISDREAGKP